ncbi:MAG: hypothetical protein JJ896_17045 [Rhodothermales bacterium]|nr:hypothetical protein [Rhodothermales bacterium]MBO6781367.1 hypothetical protein [Rhodothermales bacterium]
MRSLSLFALVLCLAACDSPSPLPSISITEALSVDTTGFARAKPDYRLDFPGDHGPHPDFFLEWWYFTGNVDTEDGEQLGYQFTIFRNALAPGGQESYPTGWSTNQLYSAHLALSRPDKEEFVSMERLARGAAGLAGASVTDSVNVWVEDWRFTADPELSTLKLHAFGGTGGLSLNLRPLKPIVLQGEQGYSPKGRDDGQASHYYAITRIETDGLMVVDGDSLAVSGFSWFDREWSTSLLSRDQAGWDWFALQLDDGYDLMYFRLRSDSLDYVDGSLIDPSGRRQAFDAGSAVLEATRFWTSPRSGARYPVAWRLTAPEADIALEIESAQNDQELQTSIRYWEGMVRVGGTSRGRAVSGRGYVEMTGYEPDE